MKQIYRLLSPLFVVPLVTLSAVACEPMCKTDNDCKKGAICVDGTCYKTEATDASGPPLDSSMVRDAAVADSTRRDTLPRSDRSTADSQQRPDTTRPDRTGPDTMVSWPDASTPDLYSTDTNSTDQLAVDAPQAADRQTVDAAARDTANAPDAGALAGLVGAPCINSNDCTSPTASYCDIAMPDGYCTAPCTFGNAGECGTGADCYCTFLGANGCANAQCFRTCYIITSCREGYRCIPPEWEDLTPGVEEEDLCYPR